ncbi:MAG: peptidylprolyl isomerase [Synergistes sp.]|nr:peptidylprolyl isomerase [Synergistes sp.]
MSLKKIAIAALIALALFQSCAYAADDNNETAVKVGSYSLNKGEYISLLQSTAGDNAMMVGLMLQQSTLPERVEMAKQMSDAMLFAEAARRSGLASRDDVALKIKWQEVQILLEAYLQETSRKWDMGEKAQKDYYEANKEQFVQQPAAHLRHIMTSSEKDAKAAILDIYKNNDFAKTAEKFSRDPNTAPRGGDLGWMEKGTMPEAIDKAIEGVSEKTLIGPVKTDLGWHVLEVLERRDRKQLSFEEAQQEVIQRLQLSYVNAELEKLREKIGVEINENALEVLAGIPAAPLEKTPEAASGDKPAEKKD